MIVAAIELLAPSVPWSAFAVIVPLLFGLAAAVLGSASARLSVPAAAAGLVISVVAVVQVAVHGQVDHAIGGWTAPLGIRLRLDGLAAMFLLLTAIVATGVVLVARPMFAGSPRETRGSYAFWPLMFFMWAGLNAVFVAADLFNLFVALEILTVSAVAMVALEGTPEAIASAMRYLLFALTGSLAYLLGVALLYAAYGTLDMALLRQASGPAAATLAAGALMTAGLMAKAALFPLYGWLPRAHSEAPAPASAMLSGLVVKAAFYVLARVWFDVLPATATEPMIQLLGLLGGLAIGLGSLLALTQKRLKLVVAYSTVAQLGYLLLIWPLAGGAGAEQPWAATAWTGGMFHALAHGLAKAAMFLTAGMVLQAAGHDRLDELAGMARHMPIAVFAFGLAALSLMGLPPSAGFTAKYLLLTSALASGQWWWAVVILLGGLLAAAYLFRVLNRFLSEPDQPLAFSAVDRRTQSIPLVLAALSVLLGIFSYAPYDLLQIGREPATAGGL